MLAEHIYAGLADKTLTGEELPRRAVFEPELAPILVEGMSQTQAEAKYGLAKPGQRRNSWPGMAP